MRTRRERGLLAQMAELDLENLKNDLINDKVVEVAVNFHAILSEISSKYSNDLLIDLIPEITSLLNKYDAALKVNDDFKSNLNDIYKENQVLAKALESEKNLRKLNLEDSLDFSRNAEEEIASLKDSLKESYKHNSLLREELKNKDTIIKVLNSDYEDLIARNKDKIITATEEFIVPKRIIQSNTSSSSSFTVNTKNRFLALAEESSPSLPSKSIRVKAQVHRARSPPLHTPRTSTPGTPHRAAVVKRRRVTILSDSQGKDLHRYINTLEDDFDVFVYSAPGSKIKNVVSRGLQFVKDFGQDDFIVLLAGSNDVAYHEPAQLTISQGIKLLLSLDNRTNIVLHHVPYRHDNPKLNDQISFCNGLISKMVRNYEGNLNIVCEDTNSVLGRHHFTRHGLHFNRRGKRLLGSRLVSFIKGHRCNPSSLQSSPLVPETPSEIGTPAKPTRFRASSRAVPATSLNAIELFPDPEPSTAEVPVAASSSLLLGDFSNVQCSSFYTENFPPLLFYPKTVHSLPSSTNSLLNVTFLEKPPILNVNQSI